MTLPGKQTRILTIMAAFAVALAAWAVFIVFVQPGGTVEKRGRVECNSTEFANNVYHHHSHLALVVDGVRTSVLPTDIGIDQKHHCIYWLHTHDASGLVHSETPASQGSTIFTLGDFFTVWGKPLGRAQIGENKLPPNKQITIWVNNKIYAGSMASVPLLPRNVIEIQVGKRAKPLPWTTW